MIKYPLLYFIESFVKLLKWLKILNILSTPRLMLWANQKELMKTVLTVSLNKGFIIVYLYKESNK